jgi:hypothetical protein
MYYVIAPTGADIMHFGKGHDDNPPGRGSGRYAWGSGGKTVTTTKKKHQSLLSKAKASKQQKIIQKANKQRLANLEAKQKALAEKERIVKSGTPYEVSLIQNELTSEERKNVLDRFAFEKTLSSYTQAQLDHGWKVADEAMAKVGKINNYSNTIVEIVKTFSSAAYEIDTFGKHPKSGTSNQQQQGGGNSGGGKKKKK